MKRIAAILLALVLAVPVYGDIAGNKGGGLGTGGGSRILCKAAPSATTTGTTEQVLATCPITAGLVANDGDIIEYWFIAKTANNATVDKRILVRIGGIAGTIVDDTGANGTNNGSITVYGTCTVQRASATTANAFCGTAAFPTLTGIATPGNTVNWYVAQGASITWANANDFVVDGVTATTAGDLTLLSYYVKLVQ